MTQTETTSNRLTYPIQSRGYIHHWLVAGPQAIAVPDLSSFDTNALKPSIAQQYHNPALLVTEQPTELATLVIDDKHGAAEIPWQVVHCGDDHYVNSSAFYHTCHYLRTWAYAGVNSPTRQTTSLILTTNGPADVWINGAHVHRHLHFHHQIAQSVSFEATFVEGPNEILICFEGVAIRECPYVMALQIPVATTIQNAPSTNGSHDSAWSVTLPTPLTISRRQHLEALFNAATVDRLLFHHDDDVMVSWPNDLQIAGQIAVRLQRPDGRIYAEAQPQIEAGSKVKLGKAYTRQNGTYWLTLMPEAQEYYVHNMRVRRHIPIEIANSKYSATAYGTYAERRREALIAATQQEHLYAEIAKMALGDWAAIDLQPWMMMIERINQRADCSDFYLIGMLGALLRHGNDPNFSPELRQAITNCALGFRYWMDEPGEDAMCFWSENHQILFHACEVLAGQLFPEATFTNVSQPGTWHRQKGEERTLSWLRKRAHGGFREWDSNTYFEHDALALSHLADLADHVEVAELAAIVLDKLFFTMAVNSFQGIFGSTHGRTYTPYIKGGRRELTSGISRLLWGTGVFNEHILGSVALACATNYELPPAIYEIGATPVEEMWSREHHEGELEEKIDCDSGPWSVDKVTYKTADYMLASAQDYRAREAGYQQHIWQATLGIDTAVFTTHPVCISEDVVHRPNFWHGNGYLPRVAQWKDLLIALYNLPDDDWMGFTHAYFPQAHFDEVHLQGDWAFARKANGYLALYASTGLVPTTTSIGAQEELRAYGSKAVWLCQMGRATQDGSFAEFQKKVLGLSVHVDQTDRLSTTVTSLRGDEVRFGWTGSLYINGNEEAITGFKHYDNPFTATDIGATEMVIRSWNHAMQLDFSA